MKLSLRQRALLELWKFGSSKRASAGPGENWLVSQLSNPGSAQNKIPLLGMCGMRLIAMNNTPNLLGSVSLPQNGFLSISDTALTLGNCIVCGFISFSSTYAGTGYATVQLSYDTQAQSNPFLKNLMYQVQSASALIVPFFHFFHIKALPVVDAISLNIIGTLSGSTAGVLFNAAIYELSDPSALGVVSNPSV